MESEGLKLRQGYFILALFLTGNLAVNYGAKSLPTGWLVFLLLGALSIPLLLLYTAAAEQHTAWEIFPAALGKGVGSLLTLLYCAFALLVAGDTVRGFSDFIVVNDLNSAGTAGNSALLLTVSVLLLLCSMETVGKAAWLIQPTLALLMAVSLGLTLYGTDLHQVLPLFSEGMEEFWSGAAISLARTLLPAVFPIFTISGAIGRPWRKSACAAGVTICLFLALISLRDTLVLGFPMMSLFRFPDYIAATTHRHSEALVAAAFVLSQPFRVALCLRYVQECLAHWWPDGRHWYPLGLAGIAALTSLLDLEALPHVWRVATNIGAVVLLVLPPLAVLWVRRRRLRKLRRTQRLSGKA